MRALLHRIAACLLALLPLLSLVACGGGNSSSAGSPGDLLTITTNKILPGTLEKRTYSTTLQASGGDGALSWSIAPTSPIGLYVNGLSIDANTGVLSGIVNFSGTAAFIATVKDSASHFSSQAFYLTSSTPLQVPPSQSFKVAQYQDISYLPIGATEGVQPLSYKLASGSFPFGLRVDGVNGQILGSPTTLGSYSFTLTVQDSYSPPEVVSTHITINVVPPSLAIADSIPIRFLLNRPYSGRLIPTGGTPPYHFAITSGSFPPGIGPIDPNSGQVSGTPTTLGQYSADFSVTDSSSPAQHASRTGFPMTVVTPLGRNDTVANATPISNGTIYASISPYIDPPDNAPLVADNDYYKLVSLGGSVVHVETQAQRLRQSNPLNSVMEIVDGNGNRLTTCRQPGDSSNKFASTCLNDDISTSPPVLDSALDYKVPGAANVASTFYVRVFDWRGNARPDMNYALVVSGAAPPLSIEPPSLPPGERTTPYFSYQLVADNGIGTVSWSIAGSSLPPGLGLSSSGLISGSPTTDGTYTFTLQAKDSDQPPQTATVQKTIQVVEPIVITSSPTLPDACVGQPYSFTFQTTGGLPPLRWVFYGYVPYGLDLDINTGFLSVDTTNARTLTVTVTVSDVANYGSAQNISLAVKQCP